LSDPLHVTAKNDGPFHAVTSYFIE